MYLVFALTINLGLRLSIFLMPFMGTILWMAFIVLLVAMGSPEWLMAVLADGLGGRLQSVSTFILDFPDFFCLVVGRFRLHVAGYFCNRPFLRKIGLPGSLHSDISGLVAMCQGLRRLEP